MTVIGQQLTAPESGWKRYDNNQSIKYSNHSWKSATENTSNYGVAGFYTADDGASIQFLFKGTKIRVIQRTYSDERTVNISIDGVKESFEPKYYGDKYRILAYEKVGLSDQIHKVEFTFVNDNINSAGFDAIDIDSDGRMFHPDEVTSIAELDIGKRIRCNYVVATSGGEGIFSNLGKETDQLIATTANISTVKGDFYLIMADEYNGKRILIADRNIQSLVSWDKLNSYGRIFGVPIDLGVKGYKFTTRLMSGGISSSDKDNEWDKYIVNSTLNGTIIAGDNNVWAFTVYSWTSTTLAAANVNRVRRGSGTANVYASNTSSSAETSSAYRPLFEVEILPLNRTFINHDGSYKKFDTLTGMWKTISATLPSVDTFINDGMDDLFVLDRKNEDFIVDMTANGSLGSGKMFKGSIDLKKYFEVTSISVK